MKFSDDVSFVIIIVSLSSTLSFYGGSHSFIAFQKNGWFKKMASKLLWFNAAQMKQDEICDDEFWYFI